MIRLTDELYCSETQVYYLCLSQFTLKTFFMPVTKITVQPPKALSYENNYNVKNYTKKRRTYCIGYLTIHEQDEIKKENKV